MAKPLDNGRPHLLQLPGSTWYGIPGIPEGEFSLSFAPDLLCMPD